MNTKRNRFAPARPPQLPPELVEVQELLFDSEFAFEGVSAINAYVDEEQVSYGELTTSRLVRMRLTGEVFDHLSLVDVEIADCELSGTMISQSRLLRTSFQTCRMSGMNAPILKAEDVVFVGCKLDHVNFRSSSFERTEFIDCELPEAEFNESKLDNCQFRDCRLDGAQFANAKMTNVSFRGSTLENIQGIEGWRGAVIGSDQMLALAPSAFLALGIEIDDDA